MLFFAADKSNDRDLVSYNISSGNLRTIYNNNSNSIRLTVDRLNGTIYWVSLNTDSSLILRKTDYSGNTTEISSSFGQSGKAGITQAGLFYYVLDSPNSRIQKYDKVTDMVVLNITIVPGTLELIAAIGKFSALL